MVTKKQSNLPRKWDDDLLACPNCGNATPPQYGKCCDVQCRVELHRWRKSLTKRLLLNKRCGQGVMMMPPLQITPGFTTAVRGKAVWVGNDTAPAYSEGAGKIAERSEMKPRPVRHLVDHNDRPEVKEPTPINRGRNNLHTGGSGKHKAKRLRGSQAKRAKRKAEILWGFGKHLRSDTVLTTTLLK